MDPVTHTFTGAALAVSGLRRATPLGAAALVIGANVPDIDIVASFAGPYASLALRRGWTHGILALAVLPFVVAGALLLWDRRVRRRRADARPPARAGPLLGLAALGVITHPALDWLNNYGIRLLMPFDGRWFYGDALFIIDPWVWLVLGGALCMAYSRGPVAIVAWTAFWILGSLLVMLAPVPTAARALWLAGVFAILALRARRFRNIGERSVERATRFALALVAVYMTASVVANVPARAEVRAAAVRAGIAHIQDVMVAPVPADPLAGTVLVETPTAYHVGDWHWLATPRVRFAADSIAKSSHGPVAEAAARTPDARDYLTWSRFPYFQIESNEAGHVVNIRDARYGGRTGSLSGVVVHLDPELRWVPMR